MARFLARPGFLLARIDQICTAIHAGLSDGETLAQAEFLMLLDRLGPMSQIVLARAAGVDKSTTAYVIDNLTVRGWAERTACPEDRRRSMVSLTAESRARMGRIGAHFAELQRQLTAPLDPGGLPRLIEMLRKLGANPMSPAPLWVPASAAVDGVLDDAPSFLTRRALQVFQAQFIASTPGLNLTLRQFSLLFILELRGSLTQVGFARLFGLDPSTCAVIIRGLARRGLIVGAPSAQDGRERVYSITRQGREIRAEAQALVDRSERQVSRGEPASEMRWLVRQLQAIVHAHSHRLRFPGATLPA
ncbi:MarR family winged helix-turn-helix transcriptional regulator [Sphingosinicella terrae]|uniref:MarR family winged helix-turn-helix transcriptional regulator n=1 Tax=Sphingosinicella terrae TaxID=2172047 RepID=UPI0013B42A18|nr:MarR family transcriptional regulator [Sphingosinicella terrae]